MEPIIHSHIEDVLDDDHPLAYQQVKCDAKFRHQCNINLHAANNECMTTWIEWAGLHVCDRAFALYLLHKSDGVLDEDEFIECMGANVTPGFAERKI